MGRARAVAVSSLALLVLPPAAVPARAGGPVFRGGTAGFGLGFYPPSHYGYNLWETNPGYYGGGSYREYYSYGRGYGLANYPGPVPGPMYRWQPSAVEPPKRLRPLYPPPAPPAHPVTAVAPRSVVAYVVVKVPPEAEVWLEGVKSRQPGATRLFVSPPLETGARYAYAVKARWQQEGREIEQSQEIVFGAGDQVTAHFPMGPELELLPTPKKVEE